jgi:protein-S-isoprenylcysteine O-methyltransferase Ste14
LSKQVISALLVLGQFGLLGLIVVVSTFSPAVAAGLMRWVGLGLVIGALLVGLLATLAHTRTNRALPRVVPIPDENVDLVQRGIYACIRHPYYTAVIMVGFGAALSHGAWVLYVFALLLALVLFIKARTEERWLAETYSGYGDYMRRTGRFLPSLRHGCGATRA